MRQAELNERISGTALVLLGATVWWHAATFPALPDGHPGPSLFPRLIAVALLLSGVVLLLPGRRVARRTEGSAVSTDRYGSLRLVLLLGVVAVFPWLREWTTFVVALSVLGLAVSALLRTRLRIAVPTVIGSAIAIYWLFTGLLGVPL